MHTNLKCRFYRQWINDMKCNGQTYPACSSLFILKYLECRRFVITFDSLAKFNIKGSTECNRELHYGKYTCLQSLYILVISCQCPQYGIKLYRVVQASSSPSEAIRTPKYFTITLSGLNPVPGKLTKNEMIFSLHCRLDCS